MNIDGPARFFALIFGAKQRRGAREIMLAVAAGLLITALPIVAGAAEGKIVVASKIDTEGALLGSMIISVLEAHGLAVDNKLQLGPTNIVRAAIWPRAGA